MNLALFNIAVGRYSTARLMYSDFIRNNTCNVLFLEAIDDIDFLMEKIYPDNQVFLGYSTDVRNALYIKQQQIIKGDL